MWPLTGEIDFTADTKDLTNEARVWIVSIGVNLAFESTIEVETPRQSQASAMSLTQTSSCRA